MSNDFPAAFGSRVIPPEDEERPVKHLNGHIFANDAFHCRPKDLWPRGLDEALPEWIPPMEIYLANFCRPIRSIADEVKCVSCDAQVTGHHAILSDYRFKQNISFDPTGTMEGRCTMCGYPCRLDHRIRTTDGQKLIVHVKNFPLFYHPSATERMQ